MPKAAVYHDSNFETWECYVYPHARYLVLFAKSKPSTPQERAQGPLGASVSGPNPTHHLATFHILTQSQPELSLRSFESAFADGPLSFLASAVFAEHG